MEEKYNDFTIDDLQTGDIVPLASGDELILKGEYLYYLKDTNCALHKDLYTKKFRIKKDISSSLTDIIKVERPVRYRTVYEREEILNDKEKEYLSNVIRPFRSKVEGIEKSNLVIMKI